MANQKLYITISDERSASGGGSVGGTTSPSTSKSENALTDIGLKYAEHEMMHFVKQKATQAVYFSLDNIGNFTGDYITQRKVNVIKKGVSNAMSIGMMTMAGAQAGPIGAAIGFTIGVAGLLTDSFYEDKLNRVENAKANYEIGQLRQRAGLNTVYDGSRGTEN